MTTKAELKIEIWAIEKLIPYDRNVKIHAPEQIERLAKSIERLGWSQPIVVDTDGVIIAGHGRRLAALQLGKKHVPVVVRYDLTKSEADAMRIADNKASSTEYDIQMLGEVLSALADEGFDLGDLGLTGAEIAQFDGLTGTIDETMFVDDIGAAVEEQKELNTKLAADIDDSAAPIADAFGFKRLTVAQSRQIRAFMTKIEAKTKLKGPDALLEFISTIGYGSQD